MRIQIDTSEFDKRRKLVKEWTERYKALRAHFLYHAAMQVYNDLMESLPSENKELRQSLRVSRITGLPEASNGYLIHAEAEGVELGKDRSQTSVLYVTAKTRLMKSVPKVVKVLEEHSPWTAETLPVQPDPKTANVVARKVGARVVAKVNKLRERDKPVWRRKLRELGVREQRKSARLTVNRQLRALPDVAFESIRLEFGLGDGGSKPHWRPAILKLASPGGAGRIARKREFVKTMTDPAYTAWRVWPLPLPGKASISKVKRYMAFQKKLGIRGKK